MVRIAFIGVGMLAFVSVSCDQQASPASPPPAVTPTSATAPTPAALLPLGGVWAPQSCEVDGQQQLNGESKNTIRMTIVGAELRMYLIIDAKEMTGRRISTAELKLDDKNGTFEMTFKDGIKKGEQRHGIYSIKDDSMKLCYGPASKPRPKEFAAKGSEVFNEVWTRANIKK